MAKINMTPQQTAVVENRGGNLLVSAAAGSGKTRVLVERLFQRVLEEGFNIDDFLIITYTRAAAAELRNRIAEDLAKRIGEYPSNRHIKQQLYRIYRADIKTIDGFCTSLLRENIHLLQGHEDACLTADFQVLEESKAQLMRQKVLEHTLEQFYLTIEEEQAEGLLALCDRFGFGRDDRALASLVLQMSSKLQSHAYPFKWLAEEIDRWNHLTGDFNDTIYARLMLERLLRKITHFKTILTSCLADMEGDEKLEKAYVPAFRERLSELITMEEKASRGWSGVEGLTLSSIRLGAVRNAEDVSLKNRMKARWDTLKKELTKALEVFSCTGTEAMADLSAVAPSMVALLELSSAFEKAFIREKISQNVADFSDQEHYAIQILLDAGGQPTELCRRTGARYAEIMVDEYQDTNEVQNTIFEALAKEKHHLFCVGDVKQSIYRFRLADPTIFLGKYRCFQDAAVAETGEDRKILLSKNFRSRKEILDGANFIFENIMSLQVGEMEYGEEEKLYFGAESYPEHKDAGISYHFIPVPKTEKGELSISTHQTEAIYIATTIRDMLDCGYPVYDDEQKAMRPCIPSDFAILMRSPGSNQSYYRLALEAEGIPCVGQETGDFFASMEIAVVVNLLMIIDNPYQDIPLISVLSSPIFAFSPDRLAAIRAASSSGSYYDALIAAMEQEEVDAGAFYQTLCDLRSKARDLPVHRLLWHLFDRFHILAIFGAMEQGSLRREHLMALYEHACSFEANGYRGLFAYVTYLRELIESGQQLQTSSGSASGGVSIMSIHKSKGLEFPIVILADVNKAFNRQDVKDSVLIHPQYGLGPRYIDLERRISYPTVAHTAISEAIINESLSEEMRILYVALTRAKEKLLIVSAMKHSKTKLARLISSAQQPVPANAVGEVSCLGDWLLLAMVTRPEASCLWELAEAEPSDILAGEGKPFDIQVIDIEAVFRPERKAKGESMPEPIAAGFDLSLLAFRYPHAACTTMPTKLTATQLKGRTVDLEISEGAELPYVIKNTYQAPAFLQKKDKLTAAEKGTAVHRAMQYLDLTTKDVPGFLAELVVKGLLSKEEADSIRPGMLENFLRSSLCEEMRQAKKLYREYCFALLVDGGEVLGEDAKGEQVMLQGVVDCFFETEAGLVVIDFKTDFVTEKTISERTEVYRPQILAYGKALARIFEAPVCRHILYYLTVGQAVELHP